MSIAELVKLTAEVPIGGSEDETAQAVKNLFRPNQNRYKNISKSDADYLDKMQMEQEALEAFCI